MKRYRLTDGEMKRLQNDSGELAEEIAEGEYTGYGRFHDSGPFDLAKESGAVAEVKSTATTLSNGAAGRFRLWKDQHEKLVRKDRNGSARYIFVLFDVSSRPVTARMVTREPAHIGNVIAGRGGWNQSGHQSGKQHKLPFDTVMK
jgi:hypothetical protein